MIYALDSNIVSYMLKDLIFVKGLAKDILNLGKEIT